MTTVETVLLIAALLLILLVVGNFVFSRLAERRNPPVGKFIECDGVRLHYIERGDPAAPCVVLFHGNGSMVQDLTISGLVDLLAQTNRVLYSTGQALGIVNGHGSGSGPQRPKRLFS